MLLVETVMVEILGHMSLKDGFAGTNVRISIFQ